MDIAISSGKGGTGKTLVATNLAYVLAKDKEKVSYLDCDVEEPNGHLFLKPDIEKQEEIKILAPSGVDEKKCTNCKKCIEVCKYNAIASVKEKILIFKELCHVCGACTIACPHDAIIEEMRKIGTLLHGVAETIDFHYALLETAEGGMSPRLIKKIKNYAHKDGINILDSPPGTACPVVETIKDADLVVLVTDPTPFGINDLKLSVRMSRKLGKEPVILVNRADYKDSRLKNYLKEARLELIGEIPDDFEIAKIYSVGDLVVKKLPEYEKLFNEIKGNILSLRGKRREVKKTTLEKEPVALEKPVKAPPASKSTKSFKELVIISGKGGTGKTSLAGAFSHLAEKIVISDCDVDASDLHLILNPKVKKEGTFTGSITAEINQEKCIQCGRCFEECRFEAIKKTESKEKNKITYEIDPLACEGCGVCDLVCPVDAIETEDAVNGRWFESETEYGPMTHAELGIAEENSGRLVTLVRNKAQSLVGRIDNNNILIDGSPGTGCPVIASLTGAYYAVIVTEPTVAGLHDAGRIIDLIDFFKIPAGIIVNKHDINKQMTDKIKDLAEKRDIKFIGEIPYDEKITEAQMQAQNVIAYDENSAISKSIKMIWNKIEKYLKEG
jgi:MinD superfamily P-loop ATPase